MPTAPASCNSPLLAGFCRFDSHRPRPSTLFSRTSQRRTSLGWPTTRLPQLAGRVGPAPPSRVALTRRRVTPPTSSVPPLPPGAQPRPLPRPGQSAPTAPRGLAPPRAARAVRSHDASVTHSDVSAAAPDAVALPPPPSEAAAARPLSLGPGRLQASTARHGRLRGPVGRRAGRCAAPVQHPTWACRGYATAGGGRRAGPLPALPAGSQPAPLTAPCPVYGQVPLASSTKRKSSNMRPRGGGSRPQTRLHPLSPIGSPVRPQPQSFPRRLWGQGLVDREDGVFRVWQGR